MTADDEVLRARHPEVKRLRTLLREREARRDEGVFVLEGPRAVEAALDRDVPLERVYLSTGSRRAFAPLVERIHASGIGIAELAEGVLEKVGRTVTPQPVLATAPIPSVTLDELVEGLVLVGVEVADPGNAGTLIRTAEAVGAAGIAFTGTSVDPWNPKTVRASAGAVCGVAVLTVEDTGACLRTLGAQGRRLVGAAAGSGNTYSSTVWPRSCAIVLGNEAHGLGAEVSGQLDEWVSIPMDAGESLNVAMAGTVLAYAWRQGQPA